MTELELQTAAELLAVLSAQTAKLRRELELHATELVEVDEGARLLVAGAAGQLELAQSHVDSASQLLASLR